MTMMRSPPPAEVVPPRQLPPPPQPARGPKTPALARLAGACSLAAALLSFRWALRWRRAGILVSSQAGRADQLDCGLGTGRVVALTHIASYRTMCCATWSGRSNRRGPRRPSGARLTGSRHVAGRGPRRPASACGIHRHGSNCTTRCVDQSGRRRGPQRPNGAPCASSRRAHCGAGRNYPGIGGRHRVLFTVSAAAAGTH